MTATAKREEMQLIAVVMGASTRDERNMDAKQLLDYGFANYAIYEEAEQTLESVPIYRSKCESVAVKKQAFTKIVKKADLAKIEIVYDIPEIIDGPCAMGSTVGRVTYKIGDVTIGESEIITEDNADPLSFLGLLIMFLNTFIK